MLRIENKIMHKKSGLHQVDPSIVIFEPLDTKIV